MRSRLQRCVGAGVLLLLVAGCGGNDQPILMHASAERQGPDEFAILPNRPLEMPQEVAALPPPEPGGVNRADPDPRADVARALGGNGNAVRAGSPASDAALVAAAGRFGRDADIRARLAAEDLAFRRANDGRLLERWFAVNVYHRAYGFMALDKHRELERWRAAGARTPAAPPPID